MRWATLILILGLPSVFGCQGDSPELGVNEIAERYVKLVLAVGQHDDGYVDAYYGPAEWRDEIVAEARPLHTLRDEARLLLEALDALDVTEFDELEELRQQYLSKQLAAVLARIDMLQGASFGFDQETEALYDAIAPSYDSAYFDSILAEIDTLLPGPEPLADRVVKFREQFVIPRDRLEAVFDKAIEECRKRTLAHVELPEHEHFSVEYVTDKPWSGYNWYQGDSYSLIQINTDLPIFIDRAVDLGCHEGYPGHHTYNALLEAELVRKRGWIEFTVYPLFSPQSLIAEGTANYGIAIAFKGEQRLQFEQDVLFPLAGLDSSLAEQYFRLGELLERLDHAGNEAARRYLDGEISKEEAVQWLMKYRLNSRDRAEQRIRFIEAYRGYVINYNVGRDMVRDYIERRAGDDGALAWREFRDLISSPRLPSGLR